MPPTDKDKLLGMIPLSEVYAIYCETSGRYSAKPVLAMAAFRSDSGDTMFCGIDCAETFNICENSMDFERYVHRSKLADYLNDPSRDLFRV